MSSTNQVLSEEELEMIINQSQILIWKTDKDGHCDYVNQSWLNFIGCTFQQALGDGWNTKIHPDDLAHCQKVFKDHVEDLSAFELEFRMKRHDGEYRFLLDKGTPCFDTSGNFKGYVGTSYDITDRKRTEIDIERLSKIQQMLTELASEFINISLQKVPNAINEALGKIGKLFDADRAYIIKYDWEKMVSKNTYEWCNEGIIPEISTLQATPIDRIPQWVQAHQKGEKITIPDVSSNEVEAGLKEILEPQGIKSIVTIPMMDEEDCIGFVGFDSVRKRRTYSKNEEDMLLVFSQMLVNVEQRKQAENEMLYAKERAEKSENRLLIASSSAQLGIWDWDIKKNEVIWDERSHELYGTSSSEPVNYERWYNELLHPEDRDIPAEAIKHSLKTDDTYDSTFRVIHKDWKERHINAYGIVVRDEKGEPIRMTGIHRDVTKEKLKEAELRTSKERTEESEKILMKLAENFPNSFLSIVDEDLTVSFASGAEFINQDINPDDFIGLRIEDIFEENAEEVIPLYKKTFGGEEQQFELQFDSQYLSYKTVPLYDDKNEIPKILIVSENITERKERELNLKKSRVESEKREYALNESQKMAKVGNWYLDIETNEVQWSEQLYKMFHFDPSLPAPPYPEQTKLFTEESWKILSTELKKTVEKGIPYELELEMIRKDQSLGWMWVRGEAVLDRQKKIIALRGVAQDITESKSDERKLKQALSEKDRLFQELHHRIKNNLHMVSSLMYTKSLLSKDENLNLFIKETINRVNSIASIHDKLLHMEELNNLSTKHYLEDLISSVVDSLAYDAENYLLDLTIEDHIMDVDHILALGLITNECISNTIKHAYKDGKGGKITVGFQKNENEYRLLIKDEGKGFEVKEEVKPRSVGLLMINQLSKQLKGEIKRESEKGASFELKFPA